jgi:hypothetical protein
MDGFFGMRKEIDKRGSTMIGQINKKNDESFSNL